jgi:hypothetical protein
MMNPAIASRIPLVCRPKPPGIPLAERISALTALTVQPAGAVHHQLVARASGILNFAALIASDAGLPGLASDLCWRQHRIFAGAARMDQGVAVMALMPVVNIARLLIREGDGQGAFDLLQRIYSAAQLRGMVAIGDHHIDMPLLIQTEESHRRICTELWITLLTDGARALARAGRWTEAAEAMAAHRGIGNRLLDGRQIMIMSLIARDRADQAIAMIDASTPAEPWESTVADLLRVGCRPETSPARQEQLDHAVCQSLALITQLPEPTTAVFRVRVGLTALDLAGGRSAPRSSDLRAAVLETGRRDAYAARDVLHHPGMRSQMTWQQQHELADVLTAAALGTKCLPPDDMNSLMAAVRRGEDQLSALLAGQHVTAIGNC